MKTNGWKKKAHWMKRGENKIYDDKWKWILAVKISEGTIWKYNFEKKKKNKDECNVQESTGEAGRCRYSGTHGLWSGHTHWTEGKLDGEWF